MGCGSSVSQVMDMSREDGFRPLRLLQMVNEVESSFTQGKMFLFGETRTQRKIFECQLKSNSIKNISTRTRIPFPKIHLDPLQALYEESQQIFHLGIYGFSMQPPFNRMLALYLQSNLIFMCGGCDYDVYNVKNESFFYSIVEEPLRISSEMIHSSELSQRTFYKPKYSNNKFQKMASMNKKRYSHTGMYCSKMKCILAFGGVNEKEEIMASCEMYSLLENTWKELPSMKVPRSNAHCFQYGNKVYIFGGRSDSKKLSKKIQVFLFESNQWILLNFKLHKGIESGLVFSKNPNQILIVGGRSHFECCKIVIKVDLKKQTYVWDSQLSHEYPQIKGVMKNQEIIIFGGEKDVCQIYGRKSWKNGLFEHKKLIEIDQLENFSFTKQSLVVKTADTQLKDEKPEQQQELFFGNDTYPCLTFFNKVSGKTRKSPVPIVIRLKSNMEIVQYEKNMYMLIGGSDQTEKRCSRSCYFYDKSKNLASIALKMVEKRFYFAAICYKNYIYVFGGYNCIQKTALSSCQKYNLVQDKWQEMKSLSKPRSKAHAEIIGKDRIAIIGGDKSSSSVYDIQIYNVANDEYEIFKPKKDIPGHISLLYVKQQQNCIFILRFTETNQYFETRIQIKMQNKYPTTGLGVKTTNLQTFISSNNDLKDESQKLIKQENKQEMKHEKNIKLQYQSYESSDLHKGQMVISSLKPQMIEIKPMKRPIEQKTESIMQSQCDNSFEASKLSMEQNIIQDIRRTGKQLIEILIKQDIKNNNLQSPSLSEQSELTHSLPPEVGKQNIEANQHQLKMKQRSYQLPVDQSYDQGQILQSIKGKKYQVIKRTKEIFFLSNDSIITYNPRNGQIVQKVLQSSSEIKAFSLS